MWGGDRQVEEEGEGRRDDIPGHLLEGGCWNYFAQACLRPTLSAPPHHTGFSFKRTNYTVRSRLGSEVAKPLKLAGHGCSFDAGYCGFRVLQVSSTAAAFLKTMFINISGEKPTFHKTGAECPKRKGEKKKKTHACIDVRRYLS